MSVSHWQGERAERAQHQDVVIGGGLVGSWAASLLRAQDRDVAIVEARHLAAGASGRNAGFVMTNQREHYPELIKKRGRAAAKELFGLVQQNVAKMRKLAEDNALPIDPAPYRFARDPAYARELEAWARALEEDGFPVEFGKGDPLGLEHLAYMRIAGDFCTQPAHLAEALARNSGAAIYEESEVSALSKGKVISRRFEFDCERIFLCLNGYSALLSPYLAELIRPARGQMIRTRSIAARLDAPGISGLGYFRQLADGRMLMGGARSLFEKQEYTLVDRPTANVTSVLKSELERLLGHRVEVEHRWAGTMGFSPDRSPIVGAIPDLEGVFFAGGFSGYGNSLGLLAAERMVEFASNGSPLGPLGVERLQT